VYKYLKLQKKVEAAQWLPNEGKWSLKVEDVATGEVFEDQVDIVISAMGYFNSWQLPQYPGMDEYEGHLRHSSNWDPSYDPTGKRVAVIGNGASGLQVVPELQRIVGHLDHYARNKTWVADAFGGGNARVLDPEKFPEELRSSFKDPETYLKYRKSVEATYFKRFGVVFKGSSENKSAREKFAGLMLERIKDKPELADQIIPDFSPNCRRPTPGPGYLEALTKDNVDFIQTPIERFTKKGIKTVDSVEREVDAIIASTGAKVDFAPAIPVIANGIDLREAWTPEGKFGFPYSYIGLATPSHPNLLFLQGPNGAGLSGTFPHAVETQLAYMGKVIRKFQSQGIKSMAPLKKAADDFIEYSDAFFPRTVLSENCSSWYNGGRPGARIHGLWPGSASHVNHVRREPRWEDWEYTYKNKSGNRFAYFGNGWTKKERDPDYDMTSYLALPSNVNLKSYHEHWYDL
jgi:cation diffusion facilitator CzcD-associated flavoprotein CzcO